MNKRVNALYIKSADFHLDRPTFWKLVVERFKIKLEGTALIKYQANLTFKSNLTLE